jgi:hypothetical protein
VLCQLGGRPEKLSARLRRLAKFGKFGLQGSEETLPGHLRYAQLLLQALNFSVNNL